jgi:hypothetical protein
MSFVHTKGNLVNFLSKNYFSFLCISQKRKRQKKIFFSFCYIIPNNFSIFKIRLWYKRRNDDNFKISLSQIFLQSSSSCYYSDKQSRNSTNTSTGNMLNLEDELCELLQENSQLKNYLKEKEEIIKLLQEKIRTTKANLFQVNEQNRTANTNQISPNDKNDSGIEVDGALLENRKVISNQNSSNNNNQQNVSFLNYPYAQHVNNLNQNMHLNKNPNNESVFDIDSSTCTATTTSNFFDFIFG